MTKLQNELNNFIGTDEYYKLTMFGGFVCTEGVKYFAEEGGAFWALDLIASYQMEPKVKREEFQGWTIKSDGKKFEAIGTDGNEQTLVRQKGATDLEAGRYEFFLTGKVLMLRTEY